MLRKLSLALGLAFLFLASPRSQADYDVATDFSLASNPNGVWSYGYSMTLTGSLILNTESLTVSGIDDWRTNISGGAPAAFHNSTQSVVTIGTLQLQPGQFAFHPGPDNEYEKARLTVPTAGTYSITGAFAGAETSGATTDVHILLDGVSIFDGVVNGFGPGTGPSFSFTRTLVVGDTLDFAVGFGSNGNYFSDSTALAAHIAPSVVPEPSAAILLGIGGFLGLAAFARRRAAGSKRQLSPGSPLIEPMV